MDIVARPLNVLEATYYLVEVLERVAALDFESLQHIRRGSIVALAPVDSSEAQLYDFLHGGLIKDAELESYGKAVVKPVPNTADSLVRELNRLQEFDYLVHDPLKVIENVAKIDGQPLLIEGNLFYLNLHCLKAVGDTVRVIRRNTVSWHFLMLVCAFPAQGGRAFKTFIQEARCIAVGAYDGESYLVWYPEHGRRGQPA